MLQRRHRDFVEPGADLEGGNIACRRQAEMLAGPLVDLEDAGQPASVDAIEKRQVKCGALQGDERQGRRGSINFEASEVGRTTEVYFQGKPL